MLERPRIINVERKPSKCPVCGERVVEIETKLGEKELLSVTAVSGSDAEDWAENLVKKGILGLKGTRCVSIEVFDAPED